MNKKTAYKKALLPTILILLFWAICSVFAEFSITLDSSFFTWILAPAQYNPVQINFNSNGNDSIWMLFLIDSKTISWENVILSWTTYTCTKQIRGLYYNAARGNRIWPLDQDTYTVLTGVDTSYLTVDLTWWLFTNCSGTGASSTGVYGQIKHTRNTTDYYITAGTTYTASGNIDDEFSNNLSLVESTQKTMSWYLHDSYGKIGTVNSINLSWSLTGNTIGYLTWWMYLSWTTYYISGTSLTYKLVSYVPTIGVEYTLSWDITATITWTASYGTTTWTTTLSWANGTKTITATYTWNSLSYATSATIFLDTQAPSIPAINTWTTGYNIGEVSFTRTTATDTGAWLSGYYYEIANDSNFYYYSIVKTGFITTSETLTHNTNFLTGTFYARMKSVDNLNNQSAVSNTHTFIVTGSYDTTVNSFTLGTKTDAKLSTIYKSRTITIAGITNNIEIPVSIEADVTRWVLFKNDILVGTSTTVENGDELYIELMSSDEYEDSVRSTLTIGSGENEVSWIFKITTKEEPESQYNSLEYKKVQVYAVFKELIKKYITNPKALVTFFQTTTSMLDEKIEETDEDEEIELLEYFKDLIDSWMDINVHTAPNGKIYYITYSTTRKAYTSPHFVSTKYFPDKARMLTHINVNNPAWSNNGTTSHASAWTTATSWNHVVDFNFQAVEYTTRNGKKTYTIGKTTTWKYFSYKFIYPRYFDTLQAIKSYIDAQNP